MEKKYFTVTENHIKLLRRACIDWENPGVGDLGGAPGIDPKRPYGNSDILYDMAEIIGLELFEDADGETHLSKEQAKLCKRLHREMEIVLQILVSNCEIKVGKYECDEYGHEWRRVAD